MIPSSMIFLLFFLSLRTSLPSFTVAAAPAIDSATQWSPNPVPRPFTVKVDVLFPLSEPLPEADVMMSGLKAIGFLALREYDDQMEPEAFYRPTGSSVQIQAAVRRESALRCPIHYTMWALDSCIRGYQREQQPWFKSKCSFFEIGVEDKPFGLLIWYADSGGALNQGSNNSTVESAVQVSRRKESAAQDDQPALGNSLSSRSQSEMSASPSNTTSTSVGVTATGDENIAPLTADSLDNGIGARPEVSVGARNWGEDIGPWPIFLTTFQTLIDRASKPDRRDSLTGVYRYSSRRSGVEIMYRPTGDSIAYSTLIMGLSTLPRFMMTAPDKFRECDFTIREDGVSVGKGTVRKVGSVLDSK